MSIRMRFWWSMAAPIGIALLLNAALVVFGDDVHGGLSGRGGFLVPPGWLVGSVWVILFALLGMARWRLLRVGSAEAKRAARWVFAFIILCAAYPFYTLGLRSLHAGFVGNIVTLLAASWIGVRIVRIDRAGAAVLGLVAGWLIYATLSVAAQLG